MIEWWNGVGDAVVSARLRLHGLIYMLAGCPETPADDLALRDAIVEFETAIRKAATGNSQEAKANAARECARCGKVTDNGEWTVGAENMRFLCRHCYEFTMPPK